MSTGKPTGADQSTSNGGGGGDPGGGSGQRSTTKLKGGKSPTMDLSAMIKWLLFPVEGAQIASEDPTLFQSIMTKFYMFEETGEQGQNTVKRVFTTVLDNCETTFERDFLFYIALAYRTRITKPKLYRGDVLRRFINFCIVQFGRLDSVHVANVLKCFFERGDFTFTIKVKDSKDWETPETGAFWHLEKAFGQLMNENKVEPRHIYPTMLWITTHLSFCAQRPTERADARIWHNQFLEDAHQCILDADNIEGLTKTLVLGQQLKLPSELMFTTNHVGYLLVPVRANTLRPFHHQRNTVSALDQCEQCFFSEEDYIEHVVVEIRDSCIKSKEKNPKKFLNAVTTNGTIHQCIVDGLHLLDSMLQVATKRWWESIQLDVELQDWLLLLLNLIDFSASPEAYLHEAKSSPRLCLQEMLSPEHCVVKRHHKFISDKVVELMGTSVTRLNAEQFLGVYQSASHIWPPQILEEYLNSYPFPPRLKISDAVWKSLFDTITERFPGAASQLSIHRFLHRVADYYKEKQKASNFIPDLLQLEVSGLFSVELNDWGQPAIEDRQAAIEYENDLRDFIHDNRLKSSLISQTKTLLDGISAEKNGLQDVVLAAVYKEMIPEADDLLKIPPLCQAIDDTVRVVADDQSWLQKEPSNKQKFCLGFINACCQRVPISRNTIEWISEYMLIISKLGGLYRSYSESRGSQTLLCNVEIAKSSSPSIKGYFKWIQKLHSMLLNWQTKLEEETVNYDEIYSSMQNQKCFQDLAQAVGAASLMFPTEKLKSLHRKFLEAFEQLNQLLLKYIPKDPEARWCSVFDILSDYGTEISKNLQSELTEYIRFPDEVENAPIYITELLVNMPSPCICEKFNPNDEKIHLWLSNKLGFASLHMLIKNLEDFLAPVAPSMELLVYFKLHRSKLFSTYMHHELRSITKTASESTVTITGLKAATDHTMGLLMKILEGTATYGEIVAGDFLDLEQLKVEDEFRVLEWCPYIHPCSTEGLLGIKCLLKLIQFAKPIQKVYDVCSQYHLENCLSDPKLKELTALVQVLEDKERRCKITAVDAKLKWEMVHETLRLKADASPKCLELFDKVADSADFYHFLEEKKFTGAKGYGQFIQELQLITRQLHQEEYKEIVLNHLFAAFTFIAPFMDPSHESLHSLMSDIADLKLPEDIPQLETVKRNIQDIRIWFSHSEDTLKNALDIILKNGEYQILATLVAHERSTYASLKLVLKYEPSTSATGKRVSYAKQMSTMSLTLTTYEVDQAKQTDEEIQTEEMTIEQINDFVHKLGFLDNKKEEDQKVQDFLQLNEVVYKLLELFGKLRQLGHPEYSGKDFVYTMPSSASLLHAQKEVEEVDAVLRKWISEMEKVHEDNKWLLFFGVPKLMILNDALSAYPPCISTIIQEISFLCKRNVSYRGKIEEAVKNSVDTCRKSHSSNTNTLPMAVVGSFLHHLFSPDDAKHWLLPTCYSNRYPELAHSGTRSSHVLHCATGYIQSKLIRLVLEIYHGPPEAFEILHCKPETSEQELKVFIKRISHYPRQYLILEINKLPYQLQEVFLQLYLQIKLKQQAVVHFIETAPSVLRDVPWLKVREYKEEGPSTDVHQAQAICQKAGLMPGKDWSCIELVYSLPGNGKTHYITEKLKLIPKNNQVIVTVNEAFTTLMAIERLSSLSRDSSGCAIFFNFTTLPPVTGASGSEMEHYHQLMSEVGWFFFNLLILGYVEDPTTGKSFHFPGGLSWALYIEIPSRATNENPHESPIHFLERFKDEVSALALLGRPFYIDHSYEYRVDEDVQLVCKYLRAHKNGSINALYDPSRGIIKFSSESNLSDGECRGLLQKYMPAHIKETKISQKLFIQYMKRRCMFLDNLPAFNYNSGMGEYITVDGRQRGTDTSQLGSTLMQAMLKEVADFVDPKSKESWSQKAHQQLIYDFKDGGGSLGLISLFPDEIPMEEKAMFIRMGVEIPSMAALYTRDVLDKYLSRALNIPLSREERLSPIDEKQYVLTLDYTLKMLNINERYECGVPVIIVGETGVGKTALIEMLSQLWNHSWLAEWDRDKDRIFDIIRRKLGDLDPAEIGGTKHAVCMEAMCNLNTGKEVTEEMLDIIAQLPDNRHSSGQLYSALNDSLCKLEGDPKFSILNHDKKSLSEAFAAVKTQPPSSKSTAHLMYIIFSAKVKSVFHKLNIHAALQLKKIKEFFTQVFFQANEIEEAYNACNPSMRPSFRVPFVTAYLDEINTASCLGLLKEIIVDRTIDGEHIPQNVFIVASCNPHRGDILAATEDHESWLKGTYNVRKLHPTLQFLMWDYGSLNEYQEREYVNTKMTLLNQNLYNSDLSDAPNQTMPSGDVASLTDLIVESQKKMRKYAREQLMHLNVSPQISKLCAKSCVSQRDIQRVFTFYEWLMHLYLRFNHHKLEPEMHHRRAMMVALGLVYYMRLSSKYRDSYRLYLDEFDRLADEVGFSEAYNGELRWFINQVELPPGIAKTEALMENVFAIIACIMTHTPLIIVGEPGSSKTLSFNIVAANFKGKESKNKMFRHTDVFKSLDPYFYQCSHRTTSNEVERIFRRAILRQHDLEKIPLPVSCVVFMDEAGLPDEKLESLKVLHYYLDKPKVSFVAISNQVLDAAKTNRAVSLFRPKQTFNALYELAKEIIVPASESITPSQEKQLKGFCHSYNSVIEHKVFRKYFGLRDFIHFINYLHRKSKQFLDEQLILESLERNFNGIEKFEDICHIFSRRMSVSLEKCRFRSILNILKDSLADQTSVKADDIHSSIQSEVRYKLIIDPSEDDSLVRLLFTHGVLQRKSTRLYICSDFPGDDHLRVNTIAQIRHSVASGHTILMCQTDEIHENFYDLFNQRFRSIEDPECGTRYYANIAIGAHSKPCRVDPDFQCVVIIKESEVQNTPAPFLNRFEKYYLTHQSLLETVLNEMPPCLRILLKAAHSKAVDFISHVKKSSLYGCTKNSETLDSLMLALLPPADHVYKPLPQESICKESKGSEDTKVFILQTLQEMLRRNAGFKIPQCLAAEVKEDADHIFKLVLRDSEFKGVMARITCENATAAINEALHVLHNSPDPSVRQTPFQFHASSCMVIAVLMQWFVTYLCKKLMQLMTPEALAVHCQVIPHLYIRNYLQFQEHFNLKELVERHLEKLQHNDWDSTICPTKLLCFTRSSASIHKLPAEYPTSVTVADIKHEDVLKEHIFTNLEHLMIYKVSIGDSQRELEKLLIKFVTSDCHLLLIIANMQEVTKKMVNHLRIMIEESENTIQNDSKLFVILLHFPPVMFFNPCYPSLFLQGWGHYYLDTVSSDTLHLEGMKTTVDVKAWFHYCCFPDSVPVAVGGEGYMSKLLRGLIPEAIPVIASKVPFRYVNGDANAIVMTPAQRTDILHTFLSNGVTNAYENEMFSDSHEMQERENLGQVLILRFCEYWTPQLMVQQINQVSRLMYAQESTLNITDFIQSTLRSAFFEYLLYMFTKINEEQDINILLNGENGSPAVNQLFLNLIRVLPIPELAQLKVVSTIAESNIKPIVMHRIPRFPFFMRVCEILEEAINQSRELVGQYSDILEDPQSRGRLHQLQKKTKEELYKDAVMARVQGRKDCLVVAAVAMDSDDGETLWTRYFEDFTHYKLHLESEVSPLTKKILEAYIGPLASTDALSRLVSLHVRVYLLQLNLNKLIRILKPISTLQEEMEASSIAVDPMASLVSATLPIHTAREVPPNLASRIVGMLFNFISQTGTTEVENLAYWYRCYGDIMSLPTMKENILNSIDSRDTLFETQLNLMHATYLVIQCGLHSSPISTGYQIFRALHSEYCEQGAKKRGSSPHLREIVAVGLKEMEILPLTMSIQERRSYCLQSFMEGLFAFFFSKHRRHVLFRENDCQYFLNLANQQNSFCSDSAEVAMLIPGDSHLDECTSINVFKMYLSRILGDMECGKKSQGRDLVGRLLASSAVCFPGPYIPTFYQLGGKVRMSYSCEAARNPFMQQPLAHLYFLTVLEKLEHKGHLSKHLVRLAGKITEALQNDSNSNSEKVLLFIEKQAVIQVLIQQVAVFFAPKHPRTLNQDLFNDHLINGINPLFSDESMGGSKTSVSWYGLTLAMQLQKQLRSSKSLIQLLSDDQSTLLKTISVVKPLQSLIKPQTWSETHIFPFIGPKESSSELGIFYKQVCMAMADAIDSRSQGKVKRLVHLASDSYSSAQKMFFSTTSGNTLMIGKKNAFRMLLWLCTYNTIYTKEIHSKNLADALSDSMKGILEPEFINLLKCFIYPKYMENLTDAPAGDFVSSAEMLMDSMQLGDTKMDPLMKLFSSSHQDPSEKELCHSMANMVAIVLACEPRSNHLWYHMFAANELSGSYMTGFMYDAKVSESFQYDCGVELTCDGIYGRSDYLSHATRGTLSLHSLCLILWGNFSAFCMALLTQPDADRKISGPVISSSHPIRDYCVMHLRNVWLYIGKNLKMSLEEQSFFLMQCMEKCLEVSINQQHLLEKGRFEDLKELDAYERMWHEHIFNPSLENTQSKFPEYSNFWNTELLKNIRCLETYYPHFPTMAELSHTLLSSVDVNAASNELHVLSKFVLEYPHLQITGTLLPDLLELYQWIHTELAYLINYQYAQKHTIEEVIAKVDNKYPALNIQQLFERVKDGYNRYLEVIGYPIHTDTNGSANKETKIFKIEDGTKFIYFLSAETTGESRYQGSDLLFCVIDQLITSHNGFIRSIFGAVTSSEHSSLKQYFPEQLEDYIDPTEVTEDVMIIPKTLEINEQLLLVRSRYLHPTQKGSCPFDLHRLQNDVIKVYLAGRPLIRQSPSVRIPFKFIDERLLAIPLQDANLELSAISQMLTVDFKLPLGEDHIKVLEYEFHSAKYHTLIEVVTGLKVATEYLIKCQHVQPGYELHTSSSGMDLKEKKLPQFLILICNETEEGEEAMREIGIKSLSPSQMAYLLNLKLPYLYSTLELFSEWIRNGMHDFHHLPLAMKKHLEPQVKEAIDKIDATSKGTNIALLHDLIEIMVCSELHLKRTIAENMQKPIKKFLEEYYNGKNDHLAELIPGSVLCQHYVEFRVFLRRKMAISEAPYHKPTISQKQPGNLETPWLEFVEDLWVEEKLKHLRDTAMPYDYNKQLFESTREYGFHNEAVLEKEPLLFVHVDNEEEQEEEEEGFTLAATTDQKAQEETSESIESTPISEEVRKAAEKLTVEDVARFLIKFKVEKYVKLFKENDIDGSLLLECSDDELKELGISSGFECRKILTKFRQHLDAMINK